MMCRLSFSCAAAALALVCGAASGAERRAGCAPEGVNLVPTGDFEKGGKEGPTGWQKADGLSTFFVDGGPGRGKCIKIDTDIYLVEWEKRQKEMRSSSPPKARPKTKTKGAKYDTVGGTKGVHFRCVAEIPVKRNAYYMISADVRGKATDLFFPKVFVKAYSDVRGESRETYNTYLACRVEDDKWTHFRRRKPFKPGRSPSVKHMKVFVYAYWPVGVYHFDNVRVWETDKDGKAVAPPGGSGK